jgi:hypothetical protein
MKFTPNDKRTWIKGLTIECPLGQALDDCPLNALRHLPVAQMNHTINALSDIKVDSIMAIHKHCYHDRLKAIQKQ